jgi:hypothetical protein
MTCRKCSVKRQELTVARHEAGTVIFLDVIGNWMRSGYKQPVSECVGVEVVAGGVEQ